MYYIYILYSQKSDKYYVGNSPLPRESFRVASRYRIAV